MMRRYLPESTEELIHWYERYISPLALVAGFLADYYIFLDRIDSLQSYVLLSAYMGLAAVCIALINLIGEGRTRSAWMLKVAPYLPVAMQFAFGALFSGFLSVYSRSASIAVSWIFVFAIAGLLIGNERFRKLYVKFSFQISLYFITLFSFLIFFFPIIFHRIGPDIFLLSGVASLCVIASLLYGLHLLLPEVVARERTRVVRSIASIFLIFNVLYFTNAIPPLPLALKEAGVYHMVTKIGDQYQLRAEPIPWYKQYLLYNTVFHRAPGESAYVYSAIFAPSGLRTTVLHQWQHKDDAGEWVTDTIVRFSIAGGREAGYRGYSIKNTLTSGAWRVNVLTLSGQVIGRVTFTVVDTISLVPLEELIR